MRGVLRIARQETRRYVSFLDRRVLVAGVLVLAATVLLWPIVEEKGVHPETGLYRVEADPISPVLPIAQSDPRFDVTVGIDDRFRNGKADLLLLPTSVVYDEDSDKSKAAARQLELAARDWLDDILRDENDTEAAFPVRVNLVYEPRDASTAAAAPGPTSSPPSGNTTEETPEILETFDRVPTNLRPDQVNPPFPMESLLLTFAYLIPLNLVGQFYSGTFFAERTRSRGVLLLSAPFTGGQILLGKSLPYLAAAFAMAIVTTIVIGADLVGFLAALPIIGFVLSSSLILGLLARNPRMLTFLLVASTVMLSTYLFLPAIFVDVHPIAFISPVSVISANIRGEPVDLVSFLYATVPLGVAALVLATLSVPMYREELLFGPRAALTKLSDALERLVRRRARLLLAGAVAVPFAMAMELFVLLFAVTLEIRVAFVFFLVGSALVEEALKGIVAYARVAKGRTRTSPLIVGLLVGGGFFLGEKLMLLAALVGFGPLPFGQAALDTFGISSNALIVFAALGLHVATTTIVAFGARFGRGVTWIAWWGATAVHAAYNATIILAATGGAGFL